MKRAMTALVALLLGVVLIAVAAKHEGAPASDVMAASQATLAAWNAGDVEAFMPHFHPEKTASI